ncbi:phage portal protein [Rhodococcus erythropolis]|uniref:phage portal protein n=1 Tax=Rhodococcus erythropolis TaxID=1833 RepID=UPI00294A08BD|nr:phage portal protein [Rhodococcus erythropolis]MDV6276384.1 phage portal protein [Rhodococcus erythropolis]
MIKAGMAWPPTELGKVVERTRESQVWWEGDPSKLDNFYQVHGTASPSGVKSRLSAAYNAFWGRPVNQTMAPIKRLHAPIAGDIPKLSASCLFSETLTIVDPTGAAQERADLIFNTPTFHGDLFTAGESASALGGSYQRVVWDSEVADNAWIDFVDADKAIPEYKWGRLVAVTFWSELAGSDERDVWRHLERYEKGKIVHSLYKGSPTNLGVVMALNEHPDTSGIELDGFDDETGGYVDLEVEELAARYVPNVLPNPEWRNHNTLRYLGRADISTDTIPLLHELDRIYSSLMRDFRIGQARMFASEDLLENLGAGKGMALSEDREVFQQVGTGVGSTGTSMSMLAFHQPEIRVLQHDQGAEMLIREILRKTGYSPVSFGMSDEVAQTATEAQGKKEWTVITTNGKARYWGAALGPLATICLRIDAAKFKGVAPSEELEIEWPEFARESDEAKSRTVLNWSTAGAASTRTKVAYLNQDKDEKWIDDEAAAIDKAGAVPDPSGGFGGGF